MKPIQVGLLGIGTVGSGTFNVLQRNQDEIRRRAGRGIEIAMVADLDTTRAKAVVGDAAKVVGEYGYADASIGRITEEADIAQGTFYLYFESRQAIFDVLLPHVGADMLVFIGDKVRGAENFLDVEERGFRAFFEYLRLNPGFFRVLNEAEVAAPAAHATHMKLVADRYVRSLKRSMENGEIKNFEERAECS